MHGAQHRPAAGKHGAGLGRALVEKSAFINPDHRWKACGSALGLSSLRGQVIYPYVLNLSGSSPHLHCEVRVR